MTAGDHLRADCANCVGLCCVALTLTRSADFAIDKAAGEPCPNLQSDFGCGIHARLRLEGFPGCTTYDCFGAGQQVVQVTFGGLDRPAAGSNPQPMFAAFAVMRQLHELLWYLTEALTLPAARPVGAELRAARDQTDQFTTAAADELVALDVAAHRAVVDAMLLDVSRRVRGEVPGRRLQRRGADLIGADLRTVGLRGADLRGAYLIGANLAGADLRAADLIGADLRAADLRGAELSTAIFLTQPQVNAAVGDAATALPPSIRRPAHW